MRVFPVLYMEAEKSDSKPKVFIIRCFYGVYSGLLTSYQLQLSEYVLS